MRISDLRLRFPGALYVEQDMQAQGGYFLSLDTLSETLASLNMFNLRLEQYCEAINSIASDEPRCRTRLFTHY